MQNVIFFHTSSTSLQNNPAVLILKVRAKCRTSVPGYYKKQILGCKNVVHNCLKAGIWLCSLEIQNSKGRGLIKMWPSTPKSRNLISYTINAWQFYGYWLFAWALKKHLYGIKQVRLPWFSLLPKDTVKLQLWWFTFPGFLHKEMRHNHNGHLTTWLSSSLYSVPLSDEHFFFLFFWLHVTASPGFPPTRQTLISWLCSLARRNKLPALLCTVLKKIKNDMGLNFTANHKCPWSTKKLKEQAYRTNCSQKFQSWR